GGRRGVSLKPATDGQDGPFQFGRDVQGDVVSGPRQVVEALRSGLQVAMPPLAEPDLGAADGGADGLGGSAGEAQGNGSMASREFVVHGSLRAAAAGGCPRREFYTWEGSEGSCEAVRAVTRRDDALSVRNAGN